MVPRFLQPDRPIVLNVHDSPIRTVGDSYRFQQVVGAIVSNALVYTEPHVELRLTAGQENRGAVLTISDTGLGLQPDDAGRVFDRFFRTDRSRARRTGGSGLGLAIAKSIVEAHDGTSTPPTDPTALRTDILRSAPARSALTTQTRPDTSRREVCRVVLFGVPVDGDPRRVGHGEDAGPVGELDEPEPVG
jgi:signal transduction histidine kinase